MDNHDENPIEAENVSQDKNTTLALVSHLLGLVTWIFGPLVLYLVSDDEFVKKNAAQAFNWQFMLSLYLAISFALTFLLIGFIGFLIFPVLDVIFCVLAAVKASKGEEWNYPITIQLL